MFEGRPVSWVALAAHEANPRNQTLASFPGAPASPPPPAAAGRPAAAAGPLRRRMRRCPRTRWMWRRRGVDGGVLRRVRGGDRGDALLEVAVA